MLYEPPQLAENERCRRNDDPGLKLVGYRRPPGSSVSSSPTLIESEEAPKEFVI